MFVGEEADGNVTEFESRDVVFLEENFPMRGEIDKDFQFYEMKDLEYGALSHSVEELEETLNPPRNSGNNFVPNSTLVEQNHEQLQPRQSIRE